MQKISSGPDVKKAAVIVPLALKLGQLFDQRAVFISKMSGYPVALHAIGRLQKKLNVKSATELLESIHRLGLIAHTTAEVVESLDATRVNQYQINRTDIVTYVNNITSVLEHFSPTEEELDLIAHLITSSEASPTAWTLQGGSLENDLHSKFYQLYKWVLLDAPISDLPIYSPAEDKIVTFDALYPVKKKKQESDSDFSLREAARDDAAVIYRMALTRIIDHVYQLLTDRDIWYQFVAPRLKTDVATNLERARTLKILALYTQSLLTYYQYFNLEMFLASYQLVQDWIAQFPSLETETTKKLEATIRSHDFLGARADVEGLMKSFSSSAAHDIKSLVFPREFLANFGMISKIDDITGKVSLIDIPRDIFDVRKLADPQYLPITSGVAASMFDVVYDLSMTLLKKKEVANQIDSALWGIVPSITRGSAKAAVSGLTSLGIRCNIPFIIPHAASYQVTAGVEEGIRAGVLRLDSASAPFSLDYHDFLRVTKKYQLFIDRLIPQEYGNFSTPFVVDYDKASQLRTILGYHWHSFAPSWLKAADRGYDSDYYNRSEDNIRQLVESISGQNYEIAVREMFLSHVRRVWATFMSSFALLYYVQGDQRTLRVTLEEKGWNKELVGLASLVDGHGMPYGASYQTLEQLQGNLSEKTQMIPLGYGLYVRFLKKVPMPVDDLRADGSVFFNQHPISYFASNSAVRSVSEWVPMEGLWNFALVPVRKVPSVPAVRFSQKYAFLTANMFINMDMYYKPTVPQESRENMSLPIVTSEWPFDRHQFFLSYNHFGPYSKTAAGEAPKEDAELLADAIKRMEREIVDSSTAAKAEGDKAGTGLNSPMKTVETEVAKASDDMSGKNLSSGDEISI